MTNEQTTTPDTGGDKVNTPTETSEPFTSDYDKAISLVKRREEATKEERKLLEEKKAFEAQSLLGEGGSGRTPVKEKTQDDVNKEEAQSLIRDEDRD